MTTPSSSSGMGDHGSAEERSALRGPEVSFNKERGIAVVVVLSLVGLALLALVLTVGVIRNDAQQTRLRHGGIPVTVTVVGCLGQLGGSGTNAAGYTCTGSYSVDWTRYQVPIGGVTTFYATGSKLDGVVDPNEHSSVYTASSVAKMHASWTQWIGPVLLGVAFLVLLVLVLVRSRRATRSPTA